MKHRRSALLSANGGNHEQSPATEKYAAPGADLDLAGSAMPPPPSAPWPGRTELPPNRRQSTRSPTQQRGYPIPE